ncbi:endonuclease III domain-containing protein [Sphingosinicella xenopeptidilytica]|uniref:Endonuclease III domain-containing protein n=1 Tax=Sphingosinicella xenopeptidilytica TaxID=364098 RepID=A0ABW3C3L8_SPHXN
MQFRFDFARFDFEPWRAVLSVLVDGVELSRRLPFDQLVKSMISGRTKDAVSARSYRSLRAQFPTGPSLAMATPVEVERLIAHVTFPEVKAAHVVDAAKLVGQAWQDYDLTPLSGMPPQVRLEWLERLPGVGRKVAASTLNASTLRLPVYIVDTHVWRVIVRTGIVPANATPRDVSMFVTESMQDWDGETFTLFHVAVKRLGQTLCRDTKLLCHLCPLAADCATARARGGVRSVRLPPRARGPWRR